MRRTRMAMVTLALACALSGRAFALSNGAAVYEKCSGCHKATGVGVPGFFPPLAGHAARLGTASRAYLIQVLLFGLNGEIRVDGKRYSGRMPAYADLLNDGEIAEVLNYALSSWGNDKLLPKGFGKITPDEVKARRAEKLTTEQVFLARGKLKLQ